MEGENYETLLSRLTKRQLLELVVETIPDLTENQLHSFRSRLNSHTVNEISTQSRKQEENNFDISKYVYSLAILNALNLFRYRQRHIALHLQYDGAKYLGFASSEDGETVESHLFNALLKLRLIESREV